MAKSPEIPRLDDETRADETEVREAKQFADGIGELVSGRNPADAMVTVAGPNSADAMATTSSADAANVGECAELLDAAATIRATLRPAALSDSNAAALIEQALAGAWQRKTAQSMDLSGSTANLDGVDGSIADIGTYRERRDKHRQNSGRSESQGRPRRHATAVVPWAIAAISAAAAIVFAVRQPQTPAPRGEVVVREAFPIEWTSRSADALIGPIDRSDAAAASTRIDAIYADRMNGYRTIRLTGQNSARSNTAVVPLQSEPGDRTP